MNTYEKPLKVLVCGTNFGRVYLKGLERCGNKFKIAGIFSHGSTQSKQEAEKYGVPLITDLNEVSKKDFDMACVVIRSTAVGGKGTEIKEVVYNDFYIGNDCDVVIVAGCGIHNSGALDSQHDGIHRFFVGRNAKVKYVEKHYGTGEGYGKRILNPVTEVYQEEGSYVEMEMVQIKGVDSTIRTSKAVLSKGAKLVIKERLMTHGKQKATSIYEVKLKGEFSNADVISRSVAKDYSNQSFEANIIGANICNGHAECDAIIMDQARVLSIPKLDARHVDAMLIHEAAIGKIAGEQLIKLMTLGLSEKEAEECIVNGFLK